MKVAFNSSVFYQSYSYLLVCILLCFPSHSQCMGNGVGDYWLVSIWKSLTQIEFTLEVEDAWRPLLPRQYDEAIMDLEVRLNFDSHQLREINSCRMYLQVITLSDITDAKGIRLLPTSLPGVQDIYRKSSLHWPEWQHPTSWTNWR